jgi:hypothetical protein
MTQRLTTGLVVAVLVLAGCRAPGSGGASSTPPGALPQELAQTPEPLPPEHEEEGEGRKKGSGKGKDVRPDGDSGPDEAEDSPPSSSGRNKGGAKGEKADPPQPDELRSLARSSDARGDQGLLGPNYADLVEVAIASIGDRSVVTVDLGGTIPGRLGEGEVMGVGLDIFHGDTSESAYQLFADGGSDGWYAYLHTPEGIVQYPGTFAIGGGRLEFSVPWNSLGDLRQGRFSAFADWSRAQPAVNASSEDHSPDSGTARFG